MINTTIFRRWIMPLLTDILHIFFPQLCGGCYRRLPDDRTFLCFSCRNRFSKFRISGLVPEPEGFPGCSFVRSYSGIRYWSPNVRNIVHRFKYHGDSELAVFVGRLVGQFLMESKDFVCPDLLVPIPLHPSKEAKRGYNQTMELCKGMSEEFKAQISERNLIRIVARTSQTKVSRLQRGVNVRGTFRVAFPDSFRGKHIMLVDDVRTTGSTVRSALQALRGIPDVKVTVFTLTRV